MNRRPGMTLLELVVVVAILAIIAGLVVPLIGGITDSARETATMTDLVTLRNTISGTREHPGYLTDNRKLPATIRDLFYKPMGFPDYDKNTHLGWRGPYLANSTGQYAIVPAAGFTLDYGDAGDPAIIDGWNRPIVIQRPTVGSAAEQTAYTRLVSAGPDGILNTKADEVDPDTGKPWPPLNTRGDDVVVFLTRQDAP